MPQDSWNMQYFSKLAIWGAKSFIWTKKWSNRNVRRDFPAGITILLCTYVTAQLLKWIQALQGEPAPEDWVQRKQLKLLNCGYRLLQLNWSSNFREFPTPEEHSVRRYSQTVLYLFRGNPNITVHVTPFYLANPMLLQAVCIQQFCCLALQWIFFLK
jgi:hypothetical protein